MRGDIIQDQTNGWFYGDNGDGTFTSFGDHGYPAVGPDRISEDSFVLVSGGKATGNGHPMAERVAVVLARRYA